MNGKSTTGKYNHIAILIDRSGSTQSIAGDIRTQFNKQAELINVQAKSSGQHTHLSLYTFSDVADHALLFEVPLGLVSLNPIGPSDYKIDGMTSLFDCVGRAVTDLSRFHETTTGDHSFLIIVLTDGAENASRNYTAGKINELMQQKMRSDVWTFVFLVPNGGKRELVGRFGLPEGNVQEWDQTSRGVEEAGRVTSQGISSFYTARAAGHTSVKSFFTTDLSGVSVAKVKRNLDDVTREFKKQTIMSSDCDTTDQYGNNCVIIEPFCRKYFGEFNVGRAFYSLTKKEKIQSKKSVVIEDRTTGKMYSGDDARDLLGLPNGVEVTVTPGDHGKYIVYVQSTSNNRKLVEAQTIIYRNRNCKQ